MKIKLVLFLFVSLFLNFSLFAQQERPQEEIITKPTENRQLATEKTTKKRKKNQEAAKKENNNEKSLPPAIIGQSIEMGSSVDLGGYQVIGDTSTYHMAFDPYNIQIKYQDTFNTELYINDYGGDGYLNAVGSTYIGDLNDPEEKDFNAFNSIFVDGGYGNVGIGVSNPAYKLDVQGHPDSTTAVFNAEVNNITTANHVAVRGYSVPNASVWGTGGQFTGGWYGVQGIVPEESTGVANSYGVYGRNRATGNGAKYGIYGSVTFDGTGTHYGVYGSASGAGRSYGVYAVGNMKATNRLFVGTSAAQEDLASTYELVVDGEGIMEELKIELSGNWPDYVFEKEYNLLPLEEVEAFINENGHLPNMPSAAQVEAEGGFFVGDVQKRLLEKMEEMTLYMIDLKKENELLKAENLEIRTIVQELKK